MKALEINEQLKALMRMQPDLIREGCRAAFTELKVNMKDTVKAKNNYWM